jgi:hypothetical protein
METTPLLVDRKTAAAMLSISTRGLDYLIAGKKLGTRRIGARVLVPTAELRRFVRGDHPEPLYSPEIITEVCSQL